MAEGRVNITVSVEVDTGDHTPMETVIKELAAGCDALLSHDVVMIETPDSVGVSDPRIENVEVGGLFIDTSE